MSDEIENMHDCDQILLTKFALWDNVILNGINDMGDLYNNIAKYCKGNDGVDVYDRIIISAFTLYDVSSRCKNEEQRTHVFLHIFETLHNMHGRIKELENVNIMEILNKLLYDFNKIYEKYH